VLCHLREKINIGFLEIKKTPNQKYEMEFLALESKSF